MKAFVDKDTCIGCGLCADTCSEIFQMEDDGKAEAADVEISDELSDCVKDAEDGCPVDAITIS